MKWALTTEPLRDFRRHPFWGRQCVVLSAPGGELVERAEAGREPAIGEVLVGWAGVLFGPPLERVRLSRFDAEEDPLPERAVQNRQEE